MWAWFKICRMQFNTSYWFVYEYISRNEKPVSLYLIYTKKQVFETIDMLQCTDEGYIGTNDYQCVFCLTIQ